MLYREVAPHRKLRHMIRCFWMLEHDYANSFQDHEQLWADAHTELIFSWGRRYRRRVGSRLQAVPADFVIGPFQHDLQLFSSGKTALVAARFWPWGFHPLCCLPMTALKNGVMGWRRVLGKTAESIARELTDLADPTAKIATLERALLKMVGA